MKYQMQNIMGFLVSALFIIGFIVLLIRVIYLLLRKRRIKSAIVQLVSVPVLYTLLLLGASLFSKQQIISLGVEKCFDDWCVSVTDWKKIELGSGNQNYYEATIQVHNQAGRTPMSPDSPHVVVLDDQQNAHEVSVEGQRYFEQKNGVQIPLNKRVDAKEEFTTVRVFELPAGIQHPTILITEGGGPSPFPIGDENSYLHKKTVWGVR